MTKYKWLIAIVAFIVAIFITRLIGGDESPQLTNMQIEEGKKSDKLIVILHAFTNNRESMRDVINVAKEQYPDADILAPNYNASTFSNASLVSTAAKLDKDINRIVNKKKKSGSEYQEIILIGHSIGALLVRKTYLYSLGIGDDHPLGASRAKHTQWNEKVKRIILLAGMNRGWSTENMPLYESLRAQVGRVFSRLTGKGKMVMSAERGAPFVSNLKMDWIGAVNNNQIKAQVIQILGENDQLTPLSEHKELMATPNFIFIPLLEGATHSNIIDLLLDEGNESHDENRELRKESFLIALATPLEELKETYGSNSTYLDLKEPTRKSVTHVVFVMHGIRDNGEWLEVFREELESRDPGIKAITSEYGWFPMARFLLFSERDKNVRWFVDQYTEVLAMYPNARKISFIGHSNGTYLLARALDNYHSMKFHRVYFAGSVVHSDYPWDSYINRRIGDFRNDIAIDDWVVAWFPKLYQILKPKYESHQDNFFNLGSGGFNGFTSPAGKKNVRFVTGGHGGALKGDNVQSIVEFITQDSISFPSPKKAVDEKPQGIFISILDASSNIAWIVWIVLGIGATLLGYLFISIGPVKNNLGIKKAIFIYVAFILAVIYSV